MLHRKSNHQYHIAIIGCGPKMLHALQGLVEGISQKTDEAEQLYLDIHVSLIDTNEFPGAGSAYDPSQPEYLLLNLPAEQIDAWQFQYPNARAKNHLSFVSWLETKGHKAYSGDSFVPKALVGVYLHDCFKVIIESLPENLTTELFLDRVASLSLAHNAIELYTENGHDLKVDEALVVEGSEGRALEDFKNSGGAGSRFLDASFKSIENKLERTDLTGKHIALHGFELPFVEVALALTQGRGGSFVLSDQCDLGYKPSGKEPTKLYPFSRFAKGMFARTIPNSIDINARMEAIWEQGNEDLSLLAQRGNACDFKTSLAPIIVGTAQRIYSDARPKAVNRVNLWFEELMSKRPSSIFMVDEMETSIHVTRGEAPISCQWALGETWRRLYSAFMCCVNQMDGGKNIMISTEFTQFVIQLNQLAFGPSAGNLRKILALVNAGIIDLRQLDGEIMLQDSEKISLQAPNRHQPMDLVIDTTMSSPLNSILRKIPTEPFNDGGELRCIQVRSDGSLEDGKGGFGGRLSVLGEWTEDSVFSLESLTQGSYFQPRNWAQSALKRAQWISQAQAIAQA